MPGCSSASAPAATSATTSPRSRSSSAVSWMAEVGGQWDARLARLAGVFAEPPAPIDYRGEIPKYGTAQPTIFWNAGAATEPP